METFDESLARLVSFRGEIYASLTARPDALFELIEAVLQPVGLIRAAVEASLSPAFSRSFSSVYDALTEGRIADQLVRQVLASYEPPDAVTIAGLAIHPLDGTPVPREDAKTMPERGRVFLSTQDRWADGFRYSLLGRVIAPGQSWVAPMDIRRVPTEGKAGKEAADQVRDLAKHASAERPKVIVADSDYTNPTFLPVFAEVKHTFGLIRLANNRVLYGEPPPDSHGNRKHGRKISLRLPGEPDLLVLTEIDGRPVRLSAWYHMHCEKTPGVAGMVVRVERLDEQGNRIHRYPLWLFWTGPQDTPLDDLARIYFLRYSIEHFFRFGKDRMGLLAAHTPSPAAQDRWIWIIMLAYWNLLLGRTLVIPQHRPWDPAARRMPGRPLTPGQVLQAWPLFSGTLGTVAKSPGRAGKAPGRAKGFHPKPRPRYPVVSKKPFDKNKAAKQKVKAAKTT